MFYILIYLFVGIYFVLMSFKFIHKKYLKNWNRSRILGLRIMGIGFLVLGLYYLWYYYYINTPEGKSILELQKKLTEPYFTK